MRYELSEKDKNVIDILNNPHEEDIPYYFFSKAKQPKWFHYLQREYIFSAASIPVPKYNASGSWSIKQWVILPYMIKLSKMIAESPTEYNQLGRDIVEWMQSICISMNQEQKMNYTVGNAFIQMASLLPEEYVTVGLLEKIFTLIQDMPEQCIDHYLIIMEMLPKIMIMSNKNKFYYVLSVSINELIVAKNRQNGAMLWFEEFMKKNIEYLSSLDAEEIVNLFDKRIMYAIDVEHEYGTRFSLYDEREHYTDTIVDKFIYYLNKLLLTYYVNNEEFITAKIVFYLKTEYYAFYKLGWFSLAQLNDKDLNEIFFSKIIVDDEIAGKGFASLYAQDELRIVLKKICPLKDGQNEKLFDFIQLGSKTISAEIRDIWLQKRYGVFCADSFWGEKYNELKRKTGVDCHLEPYITIQSGAVSHQSPLQENEILKMPEDELINMLKAFRGKSFSGDMPSVTGLANTMREVIRKHASEFPVAWEAFLEVDFVYVYSMLDGLRSYEDKINISWGSILSFLIKYIQQPAFADGTLKNADDEWKVDMQGFSNMVLLLVRDIPGYYKEKQEIATYICHLSKSFDERPRLAFDVVFNTVRGKAFYSMLLLEETASSHVDTTPIFSILNESIIKRDRTAIMFFGYFCQKFFELNVDWFVEHLRIIECCDESCPMWFLEGYFSLKDSFHKVAPRMEKLYKYAIGRDFVGVSNWQVAQHMTCMYLNDFFGAEESRTIFYDYLADAKKRGSAIWADIIKYITSPNALVDKRKDIEAKIISFWSYLNKTDEVPSDALWDAIDFIRFSSNITDEQSKWIKQSIDKVEIHLNIYRFLKTLEAVWEKGRKNSKEQLTAQFIGEWLCELVKNVDNIYFYDTKRWQRLVKGVVEKGSRETQNILKDFNDICMKNGHDIFADIFKTLN